MSSFSVINSLQPSLRTQFSAELEKFLSGEEKIHVRLGCATHLGNVGGLL